MDLLLIISIGLSFSLTSTCIAYFISKREYFARAIKMYKELSSKEMIEGRDKRSLRRIRRIRSELKKTRRRITLLFLISIIVFSLMYLLSSLLTYLLYPGLHGLKKIPFAIPLLAREVNGEYYTHAVIIVFLSFMMPSYLFTRIIKI